MDAALAYTTLAMTVGLAVSRPRIGRTTLRVTPGLAALLGVVILLASGLLRLDDLRTSARIQWRPLLTVTCIMLMTGVVHEVRAFERMATRLEAHAKRTSPARAFDLVFLASVLTPSLLNNDAAILLLTPVVIALAKRAYPGNTRLLEALVFAVFLAPGVAPFVISNPMNMIVAEFAGIGFNAYAAIMGPISVVGAIVTFLILRFHYRDVLRPRAVEQVLPEHGAAARTEITSDAARPASPPASARHRAERPALALLLVVFFSYPVAAAAGVPIFWVAIGGAVGAVGLVRAYRIAKPKVVARHVSFDILVFLWGVFLVVVGLRGVGVVDALSGLYGAHTGGAALGVVSVTSALGSAIVDNHPMSILNMLALEHHANPRLLLAALIGGDIGPRLLPIGSLAGLLWMDLLRRSGVEIGIVKFVRLGTLILLPTLAVSLAMLWLL